MIILCSWFKYTVLIDAMVEKDMWLHEKEILIIYVIINTITIPIRQTLCYNVGGKFPPI